MLAIIYRLKIRLVNFTAYCNIYSCSLMFGVFGAILQMLIQVWFFWELNQY